MPIKAMLRAKFDFEGSEAEELSFKIGETIYLLYKDSSGWAKGRKGSGEKGWFPIDYAEMIVDVEESAAKDLTEAGASSEGTTAVVEKSTSSESASSSPSIPSTVPDYEQGLGCFPLDAGR
eukprot:TRINITY_DN3317_c0_g1_i2.p1 TRINITY_DN3317_c0_g1~~TRINITY_DN3317_c0_g1_i2.p1  ORF type:complete len:121 (+),score=15.53 TRINITY_DN3317_c0_g1_i2:164-526(+)